MPGISSNCPYADYLNLYLKGELSDTQAIRIASIVEDQGIITLAKLLEWVKTLQKHPPLHVNVDLLHFRTTCEYASTSQEWTNSIIDSVRNKVPHIQSLLHDGLNIENSYGKLARTLLHLAVISKDKQLVKLLIRYKANPNAKDRENRTPLFYAYISNQLDIVEMLLQAGANVNEKCESAQQTLLHAAASAGNRKFVEFLIRGTANLVASVDVNVRDKEGMTPLMMAVSEGHADVAQLLISHGAEVDARCGVDWTALMIAVEEGNANLARLLISHGANVNIRDTDGLTPLWIAASRGDLEIVKILLNSKANVNIVNKEGNTILCSLKSRRPPHWKLIRQLIKPRTSAEMNNYTKFHYKTKLLANAFEFQSSSTFQGKVSIWEGGSAELTAIQMARSIPLFAASSPSLDKTTASILSECLQFAADHKSHSPEQYLQRIKQGKPTFILTGYVEHSVTVFIWNDIFTICDRAKPQNRIEIHRFDPKKLNIDSIQLLDEISVQDEENYIEAMINILPKRLNFTRSERELNLLKLLDIPEQLAGNCNWAALEGMVKVFLLLAKLKESGFRVTSEASEQLKQSVNNTFASWLIFQQIYLLEKYIASDHHDDQLVLKCFNALWSVKSIIPQAFVNLTKPLEELAIKFIKTASADKARLLRINQTWITCQPSVQPPESVLEVLGTLSLMQAFAE